MLTSETTIRIDRPSRYLIQFCRHAAAMGRTGGGHRPRGHATQDALARGELQIHTEYTKTRGVVTINPWGRCTLRAAADTLTLRVDATDQDAVRRIQDIVTRDLERFGRRDGLTVTWPPPRASDAAPATVEAGAIPPPISKSTEHPNRRSAILLAVLIVVAIAIHLGLGAEILTSSRWASLFADVLLAIALGKTLLAALGGRALHRHIRRGGPHLHPWTRHHSGPDTAIPAVDPAVDSDQAPADIPPGTTPACRVTDRPVPRQP